MTKPIEMRILQGGDTTNSLPPPKNFGKGGKFPRAPEWLGELAQEKWEEVGRLLWEIEVVHRADLDILALYCASYERWRMAQDVYAAQFAEMGAEATMIWDEKSSRWIRNPYPGMIRAEQEILLRTGNALGLSPTARAKLSLMETANGDDVKAEKAKKYFANGRSSVRYKAKKRK